MRNSKSVIINSALKKTRHLLKIFHSLTLTNETPGGSGMIRRCWNWIHTSIAPLQLGGSGDPKATHITRNEELPRGLCIHG